MSGPTFTAPDARWAAVLGRERAADGAFVYAVATTGVFCRPSCSSRRPRRQNVEFFASGHAATRAGYRACKRCAPTGRDPREAARDLVVEACRRLAGETARTAEVARALGLSPFYFQRLFKKHLGVTPQAYRRRVLAEGAKQGILRARSVTAAIYDAGYSSSSRFYAVAGRELGMAPRLVRQGGRGQRVRYVTRSCSLGRLLVAWTDGGVCAVQFGAAERELVADLRARFPKAVLEGGKLPRWIHDVVEAVERPRALDVPLDIAGTAFQERVWQELRRIPVGQTRTYAEVARAIGAAGAARAVARACATNEVALVIPCHRVVRADGEASGYRWGRARKKALLRREAGHR